MNDPQNPNREEKKMNWLQKLGVEKAYGILMISIILSLALIALGSRSTMFSAIYFILLFTLFGLSGLVLIYFKEMPGLFKPIKGTSVVITGYIFVIASVISISIIIFGLLTN